MKITKKEFNVLDAILINEYVDTDSGEPEANYPTWLSIVSDYSYTGKTFSGITSALSEKGFIRIMGSGNDATICATEDGLKAFNEYKRLTDES